LWASYFLLLTIAVMTGTHTAFFPLRWGLPSFFFFFLVWSGTIILLISVSQVARIIGVGYWNLPQSPISKHHSQIKFLPS
jgi:hypothetical protein